MTHFNIGNPEKAMSKETSHGANYSKALLDINIKQSKTPLLNLEVMKELRKAHFNFGTDATSY